jgi:preprotein translocase subunit SecF
VASARRTRSATSTARGSSVAVAERPQALPDRPDADVPVESPASVQPTSTGATAAPRPGQRPQRPGTKPVQRPAGKKRR